MGVDSHLVSEKDIGFCHFCQKYLWKNILEKGCHISMDTCTYSTFILFLPAKKPPQMFCWNCFSRWVICLEIPLKLSNPAAIPYKRHEISHSPEGWGAWDCRMVDTWSSGKVVMGQCTLLSLKEATFHPEVTVSHTAAVNTASQAVMANTKMLCGFQQRLYQFSNFNRDEQCISRSSCSLPVG